MYKVFNKNGVTLVEMCVNITLVIFIIILLRGVFYNSFLHLQSIKYNTNQISCLQKIYINLENDLKFAYKVDVKEQELIIEKNTETIRYYISNNHLFRNNNDIVNMKDVELTFSELPSEKYKNKIVHIKTVYKEKELNNTHTVELTKDISTIQNMH